MSGDDHAPSNAPGGTASNFDRFKALSPAGCIVANWECVRSHLLHLPEQPADERAGGGLPRRRLRDRASTPRRLLPATALTQAELSALLRHAARAVRGPSTRACRGPSRAARTASTGPTGRRRPRSSSRTASAWTRNYYHYPGRWIGAKPGFMNGGGFPMRFADLDGTPIDVYQQNTHMRRRGEPGVPGDRQRAARQRARPARLLRRLRHEHAHGRLRRPTRLRRRSSRPRRHAASRSSRTSRCSTGSTAATTPPSAPSAGTPAPSTFTTTVGSRGDRPPDDAPDPGPRRARSPRSRATASPVPYTLQTIKGIQYALFAAVTGTYQATYS